MSVPKICNFSGHSHRFYKFSSALPSPHTKQALISVSPPVLPPKMARSRRALVLLFLSVALATVAVAAARDAPLEEEKVSLPGAFDPSKIAACWGSLMSIPSCSREVLTSFLTFRLQIGPECCKSMDKIGRKCFEDIFYNPLLPLPPFNPFIGAKLFCKNPNLPAPPAA